MAAEHSVNDIQEQLQALFKLVDDQPEHRDPYPKPTVTEGNKILALKKDWLKSICCLNLVATHKFVDRVWQSLQQRLDTLKTALNDGRALRFDVLVLGIASPRAHIQCAYKRVAALTCLCPGSAELAETPREPRTLLHARKSIHRHVLCGGTPR